MKTDLQIAQECTMEPIVSVAAKAGIPEDYLECYGKYKAKISAAYDAELKDRPSISPFFRIYAYPVICPALIIGFSKRRLRTNAFFVP